jgi:iron complex transport system substrate-binding protein
VSLNLCTDELLVDLAPEQILALSPLARDANLSAVARGAARWPQIRPDAEAILALHPDLVLAGAYGAQAVLAVLRARGVRVMQFDEPTDFAGVAAEIAGAAEVLGVRARGAALASRMWSRLAALPRRARGRAVLWQARGYSAGPGSFGDAVLRVAGFTNLGTGGQMGIEALVAHPPDVLVSESAPATPSLATAVLDHPALARIRRIRLDPAFLACPGPWSVDAAVALAQ